MAASFFFRPFRVRLSTVSVLLEPMIASDSESAYSLAPEIVLLLVVSEAVPMISVFRVASAAVAKFLAPLIVSADAASFDVPIRVVSRAAS